MKQTSIRVLSLLLAMLTLLLVGCKGDGDGASTSDAISTAVGAAETTAPPPVGESDLSQPKNYKVLYNSDATHIMQNDSPYHAGASTTLTRGMVQEAVQEAIDAGIDCYTLAPGQCWVPWWPSQYINAHKAWYQNYGGYNYSNPYWNYIHVRGNDMIQDCIDVCRENGVGFFVSFRLNDHHHTIAANGQYTPDNANAATTSQLLAEHPEYQIGYVNAYGRTETVMDFRHEAVVEDRMRLIEELIANYELDGFELDFTRRYVLFNIDKTTAEERLAIMLDMIERTRAALDAATQKDGRYRELSVRIPIWEDYYDDLGIDLAAYEEAGVTLFNFTGSYFTVQEFDLISLKEQLNEARTFVELHFITAVDYDDANKRIHRRATVEQLCTTALIAYEQGADGISLFNFQYYRGDKQSDLDQPYTEPPWEVIECLGDYELLKTVDQHYFLGKTWRDSFYAGWSLPCSLTRNLAKELTLFCVTPAEGWSGSAVLTLQSLETWGARGMEITFNGTKLNQIAYAGKPYANEYTQMIGEADNYVSFLVPVSLLQEGENVISVKLTSGSSISLCFVELSVGG